MYGCFSDVFGLPYRLASLLYYLYRIYHSSPADITHLVAITVYIYHLYRIYHSSSADITHLVAITVYIPSISNIPFFTCRHYTSRCHYRIYTIYIEYTILHLQTLHISLPLPYIYHLYRIYHSSPADITYLVAITVYIPSISNIPFFTCRHYISRCHYRIYTIYIEYTILHLLTLHISLPLPYIYHLYRIYQETVHRATVTLYSIWSFIKCTIRCPCWDPG